VDNDEDGFDSIASGGTDCDDGDPNVYPGALDPSNDGLDQDCNGADGTGAVNVGDGSAPVDQDRDGYVAGYAGGNDCNDSDASIHPGAVDIGGDGIDQDCSGADSETTTGIDTDGDGYTSIASGGDDPDDNDPTVHPGADDSPGDGVDQDASGDDGPGVVPYDHDNDGYASIGTGGDDCDDDNPNISPGADEINGDGIDQNCDGLDGGVAVPVDLDQDGYASTATGGDDCNDYVDTIHPGANDELGDCIDQDCSGADGPGSAPHTGQDRDGDGFFTCATGGNDCDDDDASIHPGATDIAYNGIDEDCSGADLTDYDLDGYPADRVAGGTDCNDSNAAVHPNAEEIPYDGIDQDCSGSDLVDLDQDGYASTQASNGTDCDDTRCMKALIWKPV
jgi:hypothetical protein